MSKTNKDQLRETNKGGIIKTNIKARIGLVGANKAGVGQADTKAGKKASAEPVASIDNNAACGGKVIGQNVGLVGLVFAVLAFANCDENSNLAIFEKTLLDFATSIIDEFFATFAAIANTTLEREPKVCKFNQF